MDELTLIRTNNWSPLFKRYNQYVLACCEFNEDMAQEIWVRIVLKKDQFYYGSFKGWISKIANNVKIDAYRKQHHIHSRGSKKMYKKAPGAKEYLMDSRYISLRFSEKQVDKYSDIKNQKEVLEEKIKILDRAIDKLPEKQRDVVILRSCKSFAEISGIMNDSLNTTLGHMRYAKKKLRSAFKNQTIAA